MESKLNEHAYMTGFPRVNFVTLWAGLKPLSALDFFTFPCHQRESKGRIDDLVSHWSALEAPRIRRNDFPLS